MTEITSRRRLLQSAMALTGAWVAPGCTREQEPNIIDIQQDVDQAGITVGVIVSNPTSTIARGTVHVAVVANGQEVTDEQAGSFAPRGDTTVSFSFSFDHDERPEDVSVDAWLEDVRSSE